MFDDLGEENDVEESVNRRVFGCQVPQKCVDTTRLQTRETLISDVGYAGLVLRPELTRQESELATANFQDILTVPSGQCGELPHHRQVPITVPRIILVLFLPPHISKDSERLVEFHHREFTHRSSEERGRATLAVLSRYTSDEVPNPA